MSCYRACNIKAWGIFLQSSSYHTHLPKSRTCPSGWVSGLANHLGVIDQRPKSNSWMSWFPLTPNVGSQLERKRKEKKLDHEGCVQGAQLLQSTTKEGKFMADQVERGSVWGVRGVKVVGSCSRRLRVLMIVSRNRIVIALQKDPFFSWNNSTRESQKVESIESHNKKIESAIE